MKPIQMAFALLIVTNALEFDNPKSASANISALAERPIYVRGHLSSVPAGEKLLEEGVKKQEREDYRGAIADYTEFLKTNPVHQTAYSNRGFAKAMTNDLKGAIADFDRAIAISPRDPDAYNARGNTQAMAGNIAASIRDFNLAIKFDRNFADAYYNRGISRHSLGDKRGAKSDISKAAQLFRTQKDLGGYQQAKDWIEKLR
jgi:tetratricopeptide (TPR) repeat protein